MNRESLLKEFVFFYKYTTILSGVLLIWVGVLLTIDKTTSEFFSMDKSVYTEVELRRITGLKENGVINIVFPFLNRKVRMVEN
jgi:hypothetical protein